MRENHVTILHITDLHYKHERLFNQKQVFKAFFDDLTEQCKEHGYPEVILFTGDIVHNADDENVYNSMFDDFIEELLQVTNCGLSRIYFCPGNHDLQRSAVKETTEEFEEYTRVDSARNLLNDRFYDGKLGKLTQRRQKSYFEYTSFFDYEERIYHNEVTQLYDLENLGISILTLNTSWSGYAGIDKVSDLRKLHIPEAPKFDSKLGKFVTCSFPML